MREDDAVHALVWSEGTEPEDVYPNGIHATVAEHLNENPDVIARMASMDDTAQGVDTQSLRWADTLVWYSHIRDDEMYDENVRRVVEQVTENGLGFVVLHSAQLSRPFKQLIGEGYDGTITGVRTLDHEEAHIEVVDPDHPVAEGVEDFVLSPIEVFEGPFDIPEPDDVVLKSTYTEGGEFQSGITFLRGEGRMFYLRPGHEPFGHYHDSRLSKVIYNAVRWTAQA